METPHQATNSGQVCIISIAFPISDTKDVLVIKENVDIALSSLAKVKIELRIVEMRGGDNGVDRP